MTRKETMTRTGYALLLPLVAVLASAQASPDPRLDPVFQRIQASDLRADITFLSSDALEGRMSLDRGSEVAIQFIAAEFAKAGLKPLGGDSYLQPMELIQFLPDTRQTSLALRRNGKEERYTFMRDFYGFFPHDVTVSAPLVFAGFGVTAPEFHYDDYANLDVKGKIVLVFDHEPQENDPDSIFNGLGNTRHANARLKALNAQHHGAVGILIASEPNRKHPSNIERLSRIPGVVERITHVPSQALADSEVNIPSFNISDAFSETLLATLSKKGNDLQAAIDASLKPVSRTLPDTEVEMRVVNAEMRRGTTDNVAGMIEGSDPKLKNETIIFSAHYDHDGMRNGQIFHGADDNGSGTVGVIELARAFAANPVKPKRSMVFIVFAAEERGLLGSYYYTAHPLRPLETTRAVINFDMIGRNETPSA